MKRIFANSIVLIVAVALGLTIGFAWRGKRVRDGGAAMPAAAAPAEDLPGKSSQASGQSARIGINDNSPLATRLARDLSMSSGVTRWLYWLEAMEKASAEDYPRLFQLAENNPAASRMVADRWVELYPRHCLDTIVNATKNGRGMTTGMRDLSNTLFREWPKRDPEAAIAALNDATDFSLRDARHSVAAAVIEIDAERGLRLFYEWSIENFGPRMNGITRWAAADPRHAAEFALASPAGYATRLTMEAIGKEWAKVDPAKALEFAVSKPGEFSSTLATATLKAWSGQNLNEAAAWLARADIVTRNRLSPSLVESWAAQDANSALNWCEANLSGSSLAQAVAGVMRGAAEKNISDAGALVTSLNPSSAREEAAAAVGSKWFPDRLGEDKPVDPAAVAWLAGLDRDSAERVLDEVQWRWATCDSKSMAAFLASSQIQFSGTAYGILARELARKNPMESIEWASRLPGERGLSAGGDAYAEWRRSQPDAAIKWLNELPANDTRREPFFENAIRDLAWDTQASSQLTGLSESERAIARKVIEGMKLPEDRRTSLITMLNGGR